MRDEHKDMVNDAAQGFIEHLEAGHGDDAELESVVIVGRVRGADGVYQAPYWRKGPGGRPAYLAGDVEMLRAVGSANTRAA